MRSWCKKIIDGYIDDCDIENEQLLKIKDILDLHNVKHYMRRSYSNSKDFVVAIKGAGDFYMETSRNDIVYISQGDSREIYAGEEFGVWLSHKIHKKCKKCILGVIRK